MVWFLSDGPEPEMRTTAGALSAPNGFVNVPLSDICSFVFIKHTFSE